MTFPTARRTYQPLQTSDVEGIDETNASHITQSFFSRCSRFISQFPHHKLTNGVTVGFHALGMPFLCGSAGILFIWVVLYYGFGHDKSFRMDRDLWTSRANEVRDAFKSAYHSYEQFASPHDELRPLSNGSQDNFNGWGVSTIDSLDTMFLMGLEDEFNRGVALAEQMDFFEANQTINFFETTIRYVGGLLSAYALSKEPVLLQKADELAAALLPVFNTTTGFPANSINLKSGAVRQDNIALAVIGSFQLEFLSLAHATGKTVYKDIVDSINGKIQNLQVSHLDGLFPVYYDTTTGEPTGNIITVGAGADSAYEYFLKQWLLTGHGDGSSLHLHLRTSEKAIENLLYLSPRRNLLYVTSVDLTRQHTTPISFSRRPSKDFEHLACFYAGLLALGAYSIPARILRPGVKDKHISAAAGLAQSCYTVYADQTSGLGPEAVTFYGPRQTAMGMQQEQYDEALRWLPKYQSWVDEGKRDRAPGLTAAVPLSVNSTLRDYSNSYGSYYLRPETVESIFIMWRVTRDHIWRDRGWKIFQALKRSAQTDSGAFASVNNVQKSKKDLMDEMPSFFLAETLKYLYLLFSDESLLPLDRWVFNTEAHPLPVFETYHVATEAFGFVDDAESMRVKLKIQTSNSFNSGEQYMSRMPFQQNSAMS